MGNSSRKYGTRKNNGLVHRGERNNNSKLLVSQVEEICKLMELGYRNVDILFSIGLENIAKNKALISQIRNKTCWTHISCKYRIPERSRTFSDETILWIKRKLDEGFSSAEIVRMSENKKVNKWLIFDIKRGLYTDLTGIPVKR